VKFSNPGKNLTDVEKLSVLRVSFRLGIKADKRKRVTKIVNLLNPLNNMANINFKPNEDRVLVEPAEAETKTASGIIIPDTAKEKPQKGKIIAVGEGVKDKPVTVKVGDNVLYGKYSGTEINIDGKEYLIMRNSDIFGII
jgi:chaperonin GroES